jgi:hypothetical protein
MFINNLIRLVSKPRYLEIGPWAGSTACSAIDRNIVKVTCIDNWSQFGGPRGWFLKNIGEFVTKDVDFSLIESDFRAVDVSKIGNFNVYLFDGPHEEQDQYDGLFMYEPALDDDFFFIIDDWNWRQVRDGTFKAIRETGFQIDYAIELRTTMDNEHGAVFGEAGDWHNGYFRSKLSRIKRRCRTELGMGQTRPKTWRQRSCVLLSSLRSCRDRGRGHDHARARDGRDHGHGRDGARDRDRDDDHGHARDRAHARRRRRARTGPSPSWA